VQTDDSISCATLCSLTIGRGVAPSWRAQRQIIISFAADTVLHGRLHCSDVMFQICVCGIMRYFTVFIVGCFYLADDMPLLKLSVLYSVCCSCLVFLHTVARYFSITSGD